MNADEFLGLILPTQGWFFTATQGFSKGWINTAHQTIASMVQHVNMLTFDNSQAYFALASYEKESVFDPSWKNSAGEIVGKYRQRTQANTKHIKSFFLDLDVDANDADKFDSKLDAMKSLRAFVKKVGLPRPMLVDSGGGIHAYWPLVSEVTTTEWRPVADMFKAICLHERFKADRSLTSDQARVLRCLGGFNFRRGSPVKLLSESNGLYEFAAIQACLNQYAQSANITHIPHAPPAAAIGGAPASVFADNLGASNDPLHFDRISFACAQIGAQVAVRGAAIGEKLWRAGLGIAKFCEPQEPAYKAISDRHAEYSVSATLSKMANWRTGPTACEHFHAENPVTCESCPHWSKITSPAQLGNMVISAPAPVVELVDTDGITTTINIPNVPDGYVRTATGGVKAVSEDLEGNPVYELICPYDLYPITIMRQQGDDHQIEERSIWRTHLPRLGAYDMDIPQITFSDTRKLHGHLMSKGVYLTHEQANATAKYMSAYLQVLAMQSDRERIYEHLGWNPDHTAFVLGDRVLHRDGTSVPYKPPRSVEKVTQGGVHAGGTLDGWRDAMAFYNRPGYEGHRFFIYASFGAPLFHMNDTGNKGVFLTASGESGRGKTTCLRASASVWGVPEHLILNGNKDGSTTNALYEILGTYHSLPFFWDDTTERDPDELRRFMLNFSQGKGKERMNSGPGKTWETMGMGTSNTDSIQNIVSSGKAVDPHLMRLVEVEFKAIHTDTESKIAADRFLRSINSNYGHAGPVFMKFITANYDAVARQYVKNVAMVDRLLNSSNASAERYWSAAVAAAYTGAQIAAKLGILDYPYEEDLKWMVNHMVQQRLVIKESTASTTDLLSEFLEMHVGHTLVVSAKQASNLDNVILRPFGALLIRHELDAGLIYVARSAVMDYCAKVKASFRTLESDLETRGILLARNAQKVLGADTQYSKGQTRAWKIDATKLVLPPILTQGVTK